MTSRPLDSGTEHFQPSNLEITSVDTGSYPVNSLGSFSINGSYLTYTTVPEPTSALVGVLLAAGLLRRKRD